MSTASLSTRPPIAEPEAWKPVAGYEGRYEISDQGRVWSTVSSIILKPGPTSRGYLTVNLYDGSRPKQSKSHCVHDLVAAAFIGLKPPGLQVDHGKLGKQNNSAGNLEYVTQSVNIRRAIAAGRLQLSGVDSPNAKLTDKQVRYIRSQPKRFRMGWAKLGKELGVSADTIRKAYRGETYKEL